MFKMIAWMRPRRRTRREKLAMLVGTIFARNAAKKRRKK